MLFEPILFGLTGTQIDAKKMDPRIVSIGVGILITGIVVSKNLAFYFYYIHLFVLKYL